MIAPMSEMDVKALQANFDLWCNDRAAGLTKSKAFERYVFEQVLKDHDPADEDLDVGDFGEGDDGGVDGMYLYMGGQLIGLETPAEMPESPLKLAAPVQPTLRRLSSFDNFRFRGRQRF